MATEIKKYVCTASTAGGTGDSSATTGANRAYASLEECMNANEQNLASGNKYLSVEITGDCSTADTAAVTCHNYTVDSSHNYHIYTVGTARHAGKWDNSKYRIIVVDTTNCIRATDPCAIIDGIQAYGTGTGNGQDQIVIENYNASVSHYISNCICRVDTNNTGNPFGINFLVSATASAYCWNCIAQDYVNSQGYYISNGNGYFYNCTAYNASSAAGVGFHSAGGTTLWKNCGAAACQSSFSGGTQTTCSTSTPTFVSTAGTYDLHLQSGDTTWKDQGTDLSADANRPFGDTTITLDIDGQTRSGSWDIGADEYVAAVSGIESLHFVNQPSNFSFPTIVSV
jgi:hypothetical protein